MAEILPWDRFAAVLSKMSFLMSPSLREIPTGSLALGLGDPHSAGTVLNCKNSRQFRSVSAWLLNLSYNERKALIKKNQETPLSQVILEDFSLDSCLSWLLYISLLHSDNGEFPSELVEWVNYIDNWEQGYYLEGGNFVHSAACMHTVYAHALLSTAKTESQDYDPQRLKQGFTHCLKLLADFIYQTRFPSGGIQPIVSVEYQAAEAALRYEHQLYQLVIQRAATCQLLVEQTSSQRKMLIDALFLNEQNPNGLFKIFARHDNQHSWSKKGFTLLGIYRPQEQGSGNDIVISVDPSSGVSLKNIWKALEQAENIRWDHQRPTDNPRRIQSYLEGERLQPGAPNQPWWDDAGNYTLLGAPKRLESGEFGSKLDWWQDILPLIWQQGFVRYLTSNLEQVVTPSPPSHDKKKVCAWRWLHADPQIKQTDITSYLIDTPTFQAWLAGHSQSTLPATPYDLLPSEQYQAYWQSDVLIVSHQQGVTLFGRSAHSSTLERLVSVAQRVAAVSDDYDDFLQQIRKIFKKWPMRLKQHASVIEDKQWEEEIFALRINALNVLNSTETLFTNASENRLSDTLQQQWGLHAQRDTLFAQLDRLEQLMQDAIARQKSHRHRIYGSLFSALGMGIAASHVWEPIKDILTTNEYEWQRLLFKDPAATNQQLANIAEHSANFELITLVVFVSFALIGFVLFWFFDIRSQED